MADFVVLSNAFAGGSFAPLLLTAGHEYFVGFRNVTDPAGWAPGANVTGDAGAVFVSTARITLFRGGGLYGCDVAGHCPPANPEPSNLLTHASSFPILQFEGDPTPEPATFGLFLFCGLFLARWRRIHS